MSETQFIELTENQQRTEALLNQCVELLTSIDQQMPGNSSYGFHKEKIQVVSDKLSHVAGQVHIIQNTLNRIYPEAKDNKKPELSENGLFDEKLLSTIYSFIVSMRF